MNAWEFISYFRSIQNAENLKRLTIPELLRLINLGYDYVANGLYPIFSDDLIVEFAAGAFDSADTLYAPNDALNVIDVYRETAKSTGSYKLCTKVPVENKNFIGEHPDYPLRTDYPYVIQEGRKLLIYPAFPASPDDINMKIVYRRRLAHLVFGSRTTVGATDTLTLDAFAEPIDDIYNGHRMAIFSKTGSAWGLSKILTVSDYVGSTKVCSFVGTAGNDEFAATTEYRYALYPFIPEEYDPLILEATKMQLALSGNMEGDPTVTEKGLILRLNHALELNGYEQLKGRQD